MAISYNTGTTGTVTNSGTASSTLAIPAGVLSGDTILVLVWCFATGTGTLGLTLSSSATAPAQVGTTQTATGGGIQSAGAVWSIAAGASDPGATLTYAATGLSGASYWFNVGLVSYTGAGGADVSSGTSFFSASSVGTTVTPSATTVTAGDWQVQLLGVGPPNSNTATTPGGLTLRQSVNGTNAGLTLYIADSNASAGAGGTAIGNTTWTFGPNGAGNTWSESFTVGLAPAGAAAAAPPPLPSLPGRTWLRRYRHRQQLPPPPAAAAATAASLATGTGAAQQPSAAITVSAGLATGTGTAPQPSVSAGTWRLMDGVSGRPGVGSSGTQPPASPTAATGNFEVAQYFAVTQGSMWFTGYWWWVPAGGDTGAQKFCLYSINDKTPLGGTLITAATVTSGTLTAGGWNFIPLPNPVQLSPGTLSASANGSGLYCAMTGWTAVNGFPSTASQFGTGQPYASGITNGPLTTWGASNTPGNSPGVSSCFSTASNDPATGIVTGISGTGDLFWLDIQVTTTVPSGYAGSYRLWPNRADWNGASTADAAVNYVVATEIHLTQPCTGSRIWYYSPSGTAQLATRASVWAITGAGTGTEAVAVTSPSWKKPDGTAMTAGAGWCYCDAGSVSLAAGNYKVAVYNGAATPDAWSAKDASTDYWQSGEGASGITWGPLYGTQLSASSAAYAYVAAGGSNTPPFTDGTGTTIAHGQPTFAVGPPSQYPYLWAGVGTGNTHTQNYWVDLEAIPAIPAALATGTGIALTPAVTIGANAGLATGTGTAQQPVPAITVFAGLATGTGTALSPTVAGSGIANAGLATGAGAALAPVIAITVPASLATGTSAATAPVPAVTAFAGLATGTGAALQPAVSTSGNTTANAGLATATGTAQAPTPVVVALAGLATGTGTAQAGQRIIPAGLATAAGTAQAPALTVLAQAQAATALAAALDGTVPAQHVPAASTATVTDPRDGTATVTATATSAPGVT